MNEAKTTQPSAGARGAEKLQTTVELTPAVDVYENENEVLILADVPGVEKDGVSVHFERRELAIAAKRDVDGQAYEYARAFTVPNGIDAERITANLKHGVLTVRLPKSAALKPRAISVTAA
ncbi:MAG TPA: Hsp20/alpha crystallin family protein [Byssovorax sp.]|jgi:HSP20 family molecular chaperone IbpA